MGYIFKHRDAVAYEEWFSNKTNAFAMNLEIKLLLRMLKPVPGNTVLDIGCGTGISTAPFICGGVQATGVDPSPHMLDISRQKMGNRVDFHQCFAEDLPFEDNSFNYSCLFTCLEFTNDPLKALQEACRVTKDKIFIGALNRYSIKNAQRRIKGLFRQSVYSNAHSFSIYELREMVYSTLGKVPVSCRTAIQLPGPSGRLAGILEGSRVLQLSPFGSFIGMVVTPCPRYRLTPLSLMHKKSSGADRATGFATNLNSQK